MFHIEQQLGQYGQEKRGKWSYKDTKETQENLCSSYVYHDQKLGKLRKLYGFNFHCLVMNTQFADYNPLLNSKQAADFIVLQNDGSCNRPRFLYPLT